MKRSVILMAVVAFVLTGIAMSTRLVTAQQDSQGERSAFLSYVENKLSTPDMQIRLNGLSGALSSNVRLDSITIADRKGVWLTIDKPSLVWTRSALLTGRVQVESLSADRVEWSRMPQKGSSLPSPESGGFSLPSLPVAIVLDKLDIRSIDFGESVFGLESRASLAGSMRLEGGALDLELAFRRLDGPGGRMQLAASYANESRNLKIDLDMEEPGNGIVANLLNIPGHPPVRLSVKGDAPIDNLDVALQFDAGGNRVLEGQLNLRGRDDGLGMRADLHGPLGTIIARQYRPLFGTDTQLAAAALLPKGGGVRIDSLDVKSGAIGISASAETLADGFLSKLDLSAGVRPPPGSSVLLPFGADGATVGHGEVSVHFDAKADRRWTASVAVDDLSLKDLTIGSVRLDTAGTATDIENAAKRAVTFNANGRIGGIVAASRELTRVLRDGVSLNAEGSWQAGNPLTVGKLAVTGSGLDFRFSGAVSKLTPKGHFELVAGDLSAFSALAGRDLAGSARLAADGSVALVTQAFDLDVSGDARDLRTGEDRLDGLLAGVTKLSGGVSRSPDGLAFDGFSLQSEAAAISIDGRLASKRADLKASARLADIAVIDTRASGAAELTATVNGTGGSFDISGAVSMKNGQLLDRPLSDMAIRFNGRRNGGTTGGTLGAKGNYAGDVVSLTADMEAANGAYSLANIDARFGPTAISGGLGRRKDGLFSGDVTLASKDIRTAAAFALVRASGSVDAHVLLEPQADGTQSALVKAGVRNVTVNGSTIGSGDISADARDIFGALLVDAKFGGRNISAGGIDVAEISAAAQTSGARTSFSGKARLQNGSRLETGGEATRKGDVTELTVAKFDFSSSIADARLASPALISSENGTVRISSLELAIGNGRLSVRGNAGKTLDLDVAFTDLPLGAANAVKPDLGLAGTVSGSAHVSGDAARPEARFEIDGSGVSANQLSKYDVSAIDLRARGAYKSGVVTIERAAANNSQGIDMKASGTIPLSGPGLKFAAEGSGPLALAQPLLRTRGSTLGGTATFRIELAGSLSGPEANGRISIAGGKVSDPLSNIDMENVSLAATLRGKTVSIDDFSARLARGGTVTASGTIGLEPDLPADISVKLDNAAYSDGRTVAARASGDLQLSGSLARDPLLSGRIMISEAEITIPENFVAETTLLEVRHVEPPEPVKQTLERLAAANPAPRPEARPSVLQLDITLSAPNRLFVRGRGVDAELGGSVRLTGPATNIRPVGSFRLIRGRINIVGRRIVLTEGTVRLVGNLDPLMDFSATTTADDIEAKIRLSGRASNPAVTFSSQPELPQDEVLAYIIFGKSVTDLSPGQIARLASIAAELAGGGGGSLLNSLRARTGLDELDIVNDTNGGTAVRAGRYISDKVYLGVQAGKETEATINLDITDSLTARGAANSKGDSSLGLFFEKDY